MKIQFFYTKGLIVGALLLIFQAFVFVTELNAQQSNPAFDEKLAAKTGADEYGMKNYIFVILKTGSNTSTEKAYLDSCFAGHFQNMNKLAGEGKLMLAGPLKKNDLTFRGIFILNTTSLDEAALMMRGDAAIAEKILEPVYFNLYSTAALPLLNEAYEKLWKKKR
jgi:uncharacterized protein YciI